MGGGEKIKIPDWRVYKVDGCKELEWTRDALAQRGLKWPWLRNEVWRFRDVNTISQAFSKHVFKGFKVAAGLMLVTIIVDKTFRISEKNGRGSHH